MKTLRGTVLISKDAKGFISPNFSAYRISCLSQMGSLCSQKEEGMFFLLILRHLHEEKKNQVLEELISLCLSLSLCFGAAAPALQPPTPCAPHVSLYLD